MYCHRVKKECIILTVIKCKKGSVTDLKGYWVMVTKEATGFKTPLNCRLKQCTITVHIPRKQR